MFSWYFNNLSLEADIFYINLRNFKKKLIVNYQDDLAEPDRLADQGFLLQMHSCSDIRDSRLADCFDSSD